MNQSDAPCNDWMSEWNEVVACVGNEYPVSNPLRYSPVVEATAIWRYLEPLEFDCPLHYDKSVASAQGYPDIVLPVTAIASFSLPSLWQPPELLFTSDDRDAALAGTTLSGMLCGKEPLTEGFILTELSADYFLPVTVGDRLAKKVARLLSCTPKATKVGKGAFLVWELDTVNQNDALVARQRTTYYRYNFDCSSTPV